MTDYHSLVLAELSPTPHRLARATLIALLCALVVLASKVLSLPETALSAYLIFFVSKEETITNIGTALKLIAAIFVAVALLAFLFILSSGEPMVRVLVMFAIAFVSMYLAAATSAGVIAATVGMVFFELLSLLDYLPFPSLVLREVFWIIPVVVVPMGIFIIANLLLNPSASALLNRQSSQTPLSTSPEADPVEQEASSAPLEHKEALRFAIKATLSIAICYAILLLSHWQAIHTITITAFLVSLGTTSESLHKAKLRMIGCLIGAVVSFFCLILIIPHLDHAADLALLTALIAFPAAWISVGSEKSAYIGMQIALVFFLSVLNTTGPTVDLGIAWGRVIGVVLGNLVVAGVFLTLWQRNSTLNIETN